MNSLGIYISTPFCRSKCSYCNFASGVYPEAPQAQYVARLCADIQEAQENLRSIGAVLPGRVDTVYLGGGTPSILTAPLLRRIAAGLREHFDVPSDAEITFECAPGQLDDRALAAMVDFGANRISFGVQSLVDREAAATGRLHTCEVVLRDLERVRDAGIKNVSFDLIAGMPHQTSASWGESLKELTAAGVEHASVYILEIDEDSRLGRELLAGGRRYRASAVPSEDLIADFYEAAIDSLEAHGMRQYEISNFARPGYESRHNVKYWRRQPYLGFGLDAHSLLRTEAGGALRFQTTDVLEQYMAAPPPLAATRISPTEEMEEAWFLGLRLREGIHWNSLVEEFGRERLERFLPVVEELCTLELLARRDGALRLTRRGILFSNEVFARFLGVAETAPPVAPYVERPGIWESADAGR